VKRAIKTIFITEIFILMGYLYSFTFYINVQIAFVSSLFIILGSMYAHKKMVDKKVELQSFEDERDLLDTIEDPHELYEDTPINKTPAEELDLKTIVKEEKSKIKVLNFRDIKKGSSAGISLFRLIPYLFLILGFIALKNNAILDLLFYMPSLLIGIIIGSISGKELIL